MVSPGTLRTTLAPGAALLPGDASVAHRLAYGSFEGFLRLMDKILHDPKDPKLWEIWYIPYNGSCRILSINRFKGVYKGCYKGYYGDRT